MSRSFTGTDYMIYNIQKKGSDQKQYTQVRIEQNGRLPLVGWIESSQIRKQ
ncbi:MAG TPA: hypothetical protein VFU15_06510 [Bacteroidia bacterium]|nr:hypothetical protein [Bacteroidia bacterium]